MERSKVLKLVLAGVAGLILGRLFWVQIIEHPKWVAKAEAQHTVENTIKAKRGEIYMMDGEEPAAVVLNEKIYTLILDPMIVGEEELAELWQQVSAEKFKWYEDGIEEIKSQVKASRENGSRYLVLANGVTREEAEVIRKSEPVGVYLKEQTKRVYPEGELASRLLGFVNADGEGQYGVEGALDEELAGEDGLLKTVADVNRVALSIGEDNIKIPAKDGQNIVLTVDRNIQKRTEQIVQQKMDELGRDRASVVIMNPNTGEIMAMVNLPGYDPANYAQVESAEIYTNRVTDDPYEPASVCKSFTFATGIELGVMDADSTYYNVDRVYIDGWPIANATFGLEGVRTIQFALNWSLNVGSIQALKWIGGDAERITEQGRKTLYDYYVNHFGLGQATGIELYEAKGLISDPVEGDGRDSLYANMTFGQNMLVTMLQVAAGYASLINGGEYYSPTIVKGTMENGRLVKKELAGPVRRAISEETSAKMREMLWGTRTWPRMYGQDPEGYYIGGKTGTAQVIRDGAYVMDETVGTYVGFGGAKGELPAYLIMVRIWQDGTMSGGESHALPVFTEISNYLLDYLQIEAK